MIRNKLIIFLLLLVVILAACSSAVSESPAISTLQPKSDIQPAAETTSPATRNPTTPLTEKPTEAPTPFVEQKEVIDLTAVPELDTSHHIVPLEEIIFDTFRRSNRAVPLPDADADLIISLRDAIPPIYNPVFEPLTQADKWLGENNLVLGYADGEEAFAYPVKILNYHEIVSHNVNGRPILASYCPLCRSGIVYDRSVNDNILTFGNTSALYESDMVMLDHNTGSYWMQVSGEAIVGTLAGQSMQALPSQTTTWRDWKAQYPHTKVLSRDTGYARDYTRDPFSELGQRYNATGQFVFPVSEKGRDGRLDPGEVVLGVENDGVLRVYALTSIGYDVINDSINNMPVVIFSKAEGPNGTAYIPKVGDQLLTFEFKNGKFQDVQTGSTWNMAGQANEGELAGSKLEALPTRSTFWFSMIAAFPDLELY